MRLAAKLAANWTENCTFRRTSATGANLLTCGYAR